MSALAGNMNANGHYITLISTENIQVAGLQSLRDPAEPDKSRAVITVVLKVDEDYLGRVVAHEQLHSLGLDHVKETVNIMYKSVGTFNESGDIILLNISKKKPIRYYELRMDDGSAPQCQWEEIHN